MNCDLPSTVRALEDPELFLDAQAPESVLILDEVHHLDDPSRLLKIAADMYPRLKILATGLLNLRRSKLGIIYGTYKPSIRKQTPSVAEKKEYDTRGTTWADAALAVRAAWAREYHAEPPLLSESKSEFDYYKWTCRTVNGALLGYYYYARRDVVLEDKEPITCGARTRRGTPCKQQGLYQSGRCNLHGGLSTGPRTAEGRAKSALNGFKPKKKRTS